MSDKKNTDMTFLEHLEELRWHIIRSLVAILLGTVAAFVFKTIVFDILFLGPSKPEFFTNQFLCQIGICINQEEIDLQNLQMSGQFMTHIRISLIMGFILAFPYIVFEIWRFVSPALHNNERNVAQGSILIIWLLFILGVLFGYYVICPLSINFLINYKVADSVVNIIKLRSYISTISSIVLSSGILFQLPVFVLFLSKVGIVTPVILKKYRKHALVIILVLSALITPPDVFSQILVAVPVLVLYEISIAIAKKVEKKSKE